MCRLLRSCFAIPVLISSLLWLAAAVMCVRSYFVGDLWLWYDRDCAECANWVRSGAGRFHYAWSDNRMFTGINMKAGHYTDQPPEKGMYSNARAGQPHFAIPGARYDRYGAQSWLIEIHYLWPLLLLGIAPPIWLLRRRARRRRREAGRCRACGYDLRATPDRCPECGTAPRPNRPAPSEQPTTDN